MVLRILYSLFLVSLFLSGPGLAWATDRPGKIIFRLKPESRSILSASANPLNSLAAQLGTGVPARRFPLHQAPDPKIRIMDHALVDLSLLYEVAVPEALATDFLLRQWAQRPELAWAEWEQNDAIPLYNPADPAGDSLAGNQRQVLKKIMAYQAWNLSQGDTNTIIGILDTGTPIDHEDLITQIKINPQDPPNGIDDDGNGLVDDYKGWDFGSNDNNPTPDGTGTSPGHGTSVSSLAGAAVDNNVGIAGVGFKCRILPVKIWAWAGSFSNFKGYEAIVYAADMGCRIINCSWGSSRAGNQYEQDLINYAIFNKNALIVAAGGNTQGFYNILPANYDHVFGVTMTDSLDRISTAASTNYKLDISAPGIGVYGIKTNNTYGWVEGGSSMASPIVAGAAGLVASAFPELHALQIGEILRVNTDSIYQITGNANYRDRSGRGRLNILKALRMDQKISLRPTAMQIRNRQGIQAQKGDTIAIFVRYENYLDSIPGFTAEISANSAKIQFLQSTRSYGAMGSFTSRTETIPFYAVVGSTVNPNEAIHIRIRVRVGNSYADNRWFVQYFNTRFLDLDANEVQLTVTANGRQGFFDNSNLIGSGIRHKQSQLCGEAGLMIGTDVLHVSNSVYDTTGKDDHFRLENNIGFQLYPGIAQHAVYHANDSAAGIRKIGIGFKQSSFEFDTGALQGSVFFVYQLKNRSADTLDSLCMAHYNDWETGNYNQNFARWDPENRLGYTYTPGQKQKFAGVQLLTPGEPQFYAIDAISSSSNGNINLFNGFSLAEKWQTMSSGIGKDSAGISTTGNNVVQVTGLKVRHFLPGETRKMAFAYVFADSLAELKEKARANAATFRRLNTSPSPPPRLISFCNSEILNDELLMPAGIEQFEVYKDSNMTDLVYRGNNFTAQISGDSTLYVTGVDSLFPGKPSPYKWVAIPAPVSAFASTTPLPGDTIPVGTLVEFLAQDTTNGILRRWAINGITQSDTSFRLVTSFDTAGLYTICMQSTLMDAGCTNIGCKIVRVFLPLSTRKQLTANTIQVFPNPATTSVSFVAKEPLHTIWITDLQGKTVIQQTANGLLTNLDLSGLRMGVYVWKAESVGHGMHCGQLFLTR